MEEFKQTYSCLFTDRPIIGKQKKEHVIPRCIGGKFTTRNIMSSQVNNDLSNWDKSMSKRYFFVLHKMSSMMSQKAMPGEMDMELPGIKSLKVKFINGQIVLKPKIQDVIINNERYKVANSATELQRLSISKSKTIKSLVLSDYYDKFGDNISVDSELVNPFFDLALIKTAIGCVAYYAISINKLDVLNVLKPTARHLFRSLTNEVDQSECIARYSFGFQAEKQAYFLDLIRKHCGELMPFCHYIIGFTNHCTKTLDVAILLFGSELFGIRVATNCNIPLSFIMKNGIFKDDLPIRPFEFFPDDNTQILFTDKKSILQRNIEDYDSHFYLQTVSMDNLMNESEYFMQVNSFNAFKHSIVNTAAMRADDLTQAEFQNLGGYLKWKVRNYFNLNTVQDSCQLNYLFDKFVNHRFTNELINDEILRLAFADYSNLIEELADRYGKPKIMNHREFTCEKRNLI